MRIENYLNTTKEKVEGKEHDIWIGISLGNKYFTPENIGKYISWALEHTQNGILIVIADTLQAINLEILDGRSAEAARRKAIELGDIKINEIENIISPLSEEQKGKIRLIRWDDIINSDSYKKRLRLVNDFFNENKDFHRYVIESVKAGRKDRLSRIASLPESKLNRLAQYILNEIPIFIDGVQYNGATYTLIPYPGLTLLDELFIGLHNKTMFPELAERLCISNRIGILEAYVD